MPESKHEKRADELLQWALSIEDSINDGTYDKSNVINPNIRLLSASSSLANLGFIPKIAEGFHFDDIDKPAIDFLVAKGFMQAGGEVTDDVLRKLSDFYKRSADKADDGKRNNSLSDNYDRLERNRGKYSAEFNDAQGMPDALTPKATPAPALKV